MSARIGAARPRTTSDWTKTLCPERAGSAGKAPERRRGFAEDDRKVGAGRKTRPQIPGTARPGERNGKGRRGSEWKKRREVDGDAQSSPRISKVPPEAPVPLTSTSREGPRQIASSTKRLGNPMSPPKRRKEVPRCAAPPRKWGIGGKLAQADQESATGS